MIQGIHNMSNTAPKFRYALKAEIIKAGHKSLTDFSKKAEIDLPRISRIISGWEIPGVRVQQKMARSLGITLRELKELL